MLPPVFARTGRYKTPDIAIASVTLFTLMVGVPMLLTVGGFNIFAYLGTIAGLCVIIAYVLVNLALIVSFLTKDRAEFRPFRHLHISLGWLVVGIGVVVWLARNRPEKLASSGKVFIDS